MYAIYSNGQQVGTIKDAERCIAEANANQRPLEFRTSLGEVLGNFVPAQKLSQVPWEPTMTREDLDRIYDNGDARGHTLEEVWKAIGAK
ncbi:hypothetical protein BH11PLA2_BH11PLA2_19740 [soil metagenome]